MTTDFLLSPQGTGGRTLDGSQTVGPILVAADGSASSDAAFRAALLLAGRTGADVQVLTVSEPLPILVVDPQLLAPLPGLEELRSEDLVTRVRSQIRTLVGEGADWPIDVLPGRPAVVIARAASKRKARMIVVGLNRHNVINQFLGGDTALEIARLADVPVLAAAAGFTELPRRVLLATDFSAASVRAAKAALTLVRGYSTVYLVHAKPTLSLPARGLAGLDGAYDKGVRGAFDRVATELNALSGVQVETMTLSGNAAREILDFADFARVDLIVAGSRGHGAALRVMLGSVASKLLRGAMCSVLIVPDAASARLGGLRSSDWEGRTEVVADAALWPAFVKGFTERNAGRRVVLEINHPDLGAQAEATNYPLLGVDFDPVDARVQIMLGEPVRGARHLTHTVGDPTSIDILRDASWKDVSLRVAQGGGQTLLTFMH